MTRSKLIIFTVVFSLPITFLMLTGCAMNRDMSSGTVKQIPIQESNAGSGNKTNSSIVFENGRWQTRSVVAESGINAHSPIVEQEIVTVKPLAEPPPPPAKHHEHAEHRKLTGPFLPDDDLVEIATTNPVDAEMIAAQLRGAAHRSIRCADSNIWSHQQNG